MKPSLCLTVSLSVAKRHTQACGVTQLHCTTFWVRSSKRRYNKLERRNGRDTSQRIFIYIYIHVSLRSSANQHDLRQVRCILWVCQCSMHFFHLACTSEVLRTVSGLSVVRWCWVASETHRLHNEWVARWQQMQHRNTQKHTNANTHTESVRWDDVWYATARYVEATIRK